MGTRLVRRKHTMDTKPATTGTDSPESVCKVVNFAPLHASFSPGLWVATVELPGGIRISGFRLDDFYKDTPKFVLPEFIAKQDREGAVYFPPELLQNIHRTMMLARREHLAR